MFDYELSVGFNIGAPADVETKSIGLSVVQAIQGSFIQALRRSRTNTSPA